MKAHDVTCPTCGAGPGALCRTGDGRAVNVAHPDRITAARTETFAGLRDKPAGYRGAWRGVVVPGTKPDRPDKRGMAAAEEAADIAETES